ncbi:uncharacterized protein LOC130535264 isoform X5 [Takifugu flavidus]|nr:uncharacterized protein LOC130535264 isoform X5 [Takifugu flavidus]
MENIKQTEWFKDKLIFAFQYSTKRNVSSLPPDRLQMNIDTNSQSTLKLLNAQPGDAGYYNCSVIGLTGIRRIVWNLLVSEGPEGEEGSSNPVGNFLYLLVCVPALLVCVLALTVCLWRKRVLSKNPVEDQFEPGSGGEVTTEPQMRTTSWPENRKRSRYVERLNSIYGL